MKNVKPVALFVVFLLLFSSGCKKESTTTGPAGPTATGGTATFTLDGAGFSNQTFNLSGIVGGYSTGDAMSAIAGTSISAGDTTLLAIAFPGSTTGTFPFSTTSGVIITKGSSRIFANADGGGQIVVTSYGNVGGTIAGTFSGKLYEPTQSGVDSVTVSGGSFSALRVPNQ